MYRDAYFKIEETSEYSGDKTAVRIEINSIFALPAALKRLTEMGYDMTATLNVLTEAHEKRCKHNALTRAINDLAE